MRPKLKIGPLTQLQDARSSAAVGFDMISFSLERGSTKKLSPSLVWNIVNWIQGPKIVLDLNADSLEELVATSKMFSADLVTFPFTDWQPAFAEEISADILIKADKKATYEDLRSVLTDIEETGKQAFLELSLDEISELDPYTSLLPKMLLHFQEAQTLFQYLETGQTDPYAFTLGEEFREDAEYLDYERIDDLVEKLEELYPEE